MYLVAIAYTSRQTDTVRGTTRRPHFSLAITSVTVQLRIWVFWVISLCFNLRNILPKSGTFPLRHSVYIYRVSQEEGTKLRESVPYVKIYRYNPKHLYPKLNGYGDNGQRKVWFSGGSMHGTLSADSVAHACPPLACQITEIPLSLKQ